MYIMIFMNVVSNSVETLDLIEDEIFIAMQGNLI
jgi:hypothetical protein